MYKPNNACFFIQQGKVQRVLIYKEENKVSQTHDATENANENANAVVIDPKM